MTQVKRPYPKGYTLVKFDAVDSTNEEAKRLIRAGMCGKDVDDKTIIWATSQSEGRGRDNKKWLSPNGNLYCSIVVKPDVEPRTLPQLSFVASIALKHTIRALVDDDVTQSIHYKWPNDVLVDIKKIGGILLEAQKVKRTDSDVYVVVGVGINVKRSPIKTAPLEATNLSEYRRDDITVQEVLECFSWYFEQALDGWLKNGFQWIREQWLESVYGIGESIHVNLARRRYDGVFKGIDQDGALVLSLEDETERLIPAGDVFFESLASNIRAKVDA